MVLNGATVNGVGGGLNNPAPVGTPVPFGSDVNSHPFNAIALNGGVPTFLPGGQGLFTFNGGTVNGFTVNGGFIPLPTDGSIDIEVPIGSAVWGDDDALVPTVNVGINVEFDAEDIGEAFYDATLEPDPFELEQTVEIVVSPANVGFVAVPIKLVVSGRAFLQIPIEIQVTLPSEEIEQPVEVQVFGLAEIELPVQVNVYDQSAFAISGGSSLVWTTAVTLAGIDVSSALTGTIRVEAEESAARIAEFTLKPASGPVTLTDWVGASVTIDFTATNSSGTPLATTRIFTGIVDVPDYDPATRTTRYTCTDNFQQIIEQASRSSLDLLIGGRWSEFIFDEDADNWTYMRDQLSTVPKSLDLSAFAGLRPATLWAAKVTPDYVFDGTFAIDGSLKVELESARDILGEYIVDFGYSFERLRRREINFTWSFPGEFCDFLDPGTKTLPRKALVESAAQRSGWKLIEIFHEDLPPSQVVVCSGSAIPGSPTGGLRVWINTDQGFGPLFTLRSIGTIAKRFAQSVRETYAISVRGPSSPFSTVKKTRKFTVRSDYDTDGWEDSEFPPDSIQVRIGGTDDFYEDRDQEEIGNRIQMEDAQLVAIDIAKTEMLNAHRQNRIGFSVSMQPQLDLTHTVELDTTAVHVQGKVSQLIWEMDIDRGTAITQVVVSVSNSTGAPVVETPTTAPTKPDTVSPMNAETRRPSLGTRYGGDLDNPLGTIDPDEPFPGWSSNLSPPDFGAPIIEEQFEILTDEIDSTDRDEIEVIETVVYLVDIPNETLILFT